MTQKILKESNIYRERPSKKVGQVVTAHDFNPSRDKERKRQLDLCEFETRLIYTAEFQDSQGYNKKNSVLKYQSINQLTNKELPKNLKTETLKTRG